jgi:hypothetical protein
MRTVRRRSVPLLLGTLGLAATTGHSRTTSTAMEAQEFWSLIESAKQTAGTMIEARPVALQRGLSPLSPAEIQAFQVRYESLLLEANSWSLWGAAFLMNGGCSDDCFKYFRDWLISEGKVTFDAALVNPDSLAALPRRDYFELESFGYAAAKAFAGKGLGELDRSFEVELAQPNGKEWSEADLPALFPKLAAKYGVS